MNKSKKILDNKDKESQEKEDLQVK